LKRDGEGPSAAANKPGKKRDAQDHRVDDETRRGEGRERKRGKRGNLATYDIKFKHAGVIFVGVSFAAKGWMSRRRETIGGAAMLALSKEKHAN